MKNWILWSFSRGSFQYDVLCGLILLTIFAIPPWIFNDRPDYMRLPASTIGVSVDDDENLVYTVKVDRALGSEADLRMAALTTLQQYLGMDETPETFRVEPVRDTRGSVAAYAFWTK